MSTRVSEAYDEPTHSHLWTDMHDPGKVFLRVPVEEFEYVRGRATIVLPRELWNKVAVQVGDGHEWLLRQREGGDATPGEPNDGR